MKQLKYKTKLEDKNIIKSSEIKEFSEKQKFNYIGFFVVYFTLSSITSYLTVYLPVYLLSILNVNRSELAFIQVFSFSVLFIAPVLGIIFDKYTRYKKIIINLSIFIFLFSSLATLLSGSILRIFGLFLAINLLSHEIIKVGMSRILIESSTNEIIKDRNLIVINISSNIGGFIPSIIFLLAIIDVFNSYLWNNFFLLGGFLLMPMVIAIFCFDNKDVIQEKIEIQELRENNNNFPYYQILFLTLSFIMIWSDKLYLYPFTSWILSKFGQIGLKVLSSSYGIFLILNTLGYIVGQKISKKFQRRNIILIMNCLFIGLIILMAFSNLFFLIVVYALNWFVSGIMLLNYTSLIISISKNVKYQTVSYQMLRFAVAIASVLFIPLGTFLSSFISTEFLIIIAGLFSVLSLIPLIFTKEI